MEKIKEMKNMKNVEIVREIGNVKKMTKKMIREIIREMMREIIKEIIKEMMREMREIAVAVISKIYTRRFGQFVRPQSVSRMSRKLTPIFCRV